MAFDTSFLSGVNLNNSPIAQYSVNPALGGSMLNPTTSYPGGGMSAAQSNNIMTKVLGAGTTGAQAAGSPQTPRSPGDGVTTQSAPTNTGGGGGGGSSYQDQWLKAGHTGIAPLGYHGEAGSGSGDQNALIDQAYNPTMDYLNSLTNQFTQNNQTDKNDILGRYQTYMDRLPTEKAQSEADISQNETGVNQQLRSAYDQAVRSYNALKQQSIAKFGSGNSAGQALGELANQEFFRNQGNVANQGIQSSQQFAATRQKLNDYITQKADDLRFQKEDALKQLDRNTQQQLAQVNSQKAQTEQAKAQMKLQIIQQSMAQAQQIQAADQAFRQNLALSLVQQFNQTSGQQFSPQQVIAQIPAMMNMLTGQQQQQPAQGQNAPLQGGNILSYATPQDQQLSGGGILSSANPNDFFSSLNNNIG